MLTNQKILIRNLTILAGGTTLVLATAGLAPALPGIASAFKEVPNAELLVRLMLTLPALLGALSAPFTGILLDRWGRKPVIVTSLILFGLAGTAGYVLESLIGILVTRAVLGLAMAGLANGFVTLIADYFTGARLNQFTGYLGAASGFAGVAFQILAGYLADLGWRFPFLMHLIAFVILLGVLFAVDEPRPQAPVRQLNAPEDNAALPQLAIGLIYGIAFASMVGLFTLIIYLPFYLTTQAGASHSQVGLALSLQALPAGFISLQYQRLRARLPVQVIAGLVFVALGLNLIVTALTANYAVVVAGLLIGGLCIGLLPPNLVAWLASITPAAMRGRAVGGLNTALFLGQFVTPLLTQPLVERAGVTATFGIVGGLSLLLAAVLIGATLKHANQPQAQGNINPGE